MEQAVELALVQAAQQGDTKAMAALLQQHQRFIYQQGCRYGRRDLGVEDAVAEARVGFIEGVRRYDPTKGARLSTFAVHCMRAAIQRASVANGAVHVPRYLKNKVKPLVERLDAPLSNDPTNPITLADIVLADHCTPDLQLQAEQMRALLRGALGELHPRERRIIELRWLGERVLTFDELAEHLGVSRQRVQQVEARCVERLRALVQQPATPRVQPPPEPPGHQVQPVVPPSPAVPPRADEKPDRADAALSPGLAVLQVQRGGPSDRGSVPSGVVVSVRVAGHDAALLRSLLSGASAVWGVDTRKVLPSDVLRTGLVQLLQQRGGITFEPDAVHDVGRWIVRVLLPHDLARQAERVAHAHGLTTATLLRHGLRALHEQYRDALRDTLTPRQQCRHMTVLVTRDEHGAIQQAARAAGQSVSSWCRDQLAAAAKRFAVNTDAA